MLAKTFDAVQKGLILFPTSITFQEHPARTAEVLELAGRVGLHSIYLLLTQIPSGKKTHTIWNLKDTCVRLNVPFTVVSSRKTQILVYVSFSRATIVSERELLEGG